MAEPLPLNFAFDEHFIAFIIFLICYGLVFLIDRMGTAKRKKTSKNIRELYRASFVEGLLLEKGNMQPLQQLLQNNIAITSATLTGVIIMSGLLFDQIVSFQTGIDLARSVAMLILLGHALLSLLAQIRTMMYIPVVFGTDSKLIKQNQGVAKHEYLTRLFSSSYMLFSNAMRDIFYLFALFLWTVSAYLFMLLVFLITFIIIREETEKRARITVF